MPKEKVIRYCNKIIEISLYVTAFFIPISTSFIESFISLAIVAWLVRKIITKTRFKNIFYPNFLNLPILIYLLICLTSSIFSSNQIISFKHLVFKTAEYLLLFFIIVEIMDKRILRNILIVIAISISLIGIDGIFQYFTNWDFFRHRAMVLERITGSFTTPNDFSNYVVTLLPLVASLSFLRFKKIAFSNNSNPTRIGLPIPIKEGPNMRFSVVRKVFYTFLYHKKLWIRPTLIIISLILFVCLILSATRSAWIALLLTLVLSVILGNKRFFLFILLLIIITLSFRPLLPDIARSRIANLFSSEVHLFADRPFLLETGLNMFMESPILGQGLGTFMYNFNRFKPEDYPSGLGISYAHNCFLQMASETGILGLSSFSSIIILLFLFSFDLIKKLKENHFYYYILSGSLMGIFAYLVSSFFDTNLYCLPLAVLFWFMMGLMVGVIKIIRAEAH